MTKNTGNASSSSNISSSSPSHTTARRLRSKALVLTVTAVLVGSTAAAAAAAVTQPGAVASGPSAHRNGPMQDVVKQVLAAGAPGYSARIDDGRRVTITTGGLADTAT